MSLAALLLPQTRTARRVNAWHPGLYASTYAYYSRKAAGSLWQDSARTTPATATSDPVGAIDDLHGGGHHILQSTSGNRPTIAADGSIYFDGANAWMIESTGGANTTPPIYMAIAVKRVSNVGNRQFVVFQGVAANDFVRGDFGATGSNGQARILTREGAISQLITATPLGGLQDGQTGIVELILRAGTQTVSVDGVDTTAANSWTAGMVIESPRVGLVHGSTVFANNINWHALAVAKADPSAGERALFRSWLSAQI